MATPHIEASKGDFADVVLMPGDPLRAKMVAETYLEDPKLVNQVRGMLGYTGTYKGKRVSVRGSVKAIIRIGSAGSYVPELNLGDVVLAEYAWSESTYGKVRNGSDDRIKYPDSDLNAAIISTAEKLGEQLTVAPIHSTDVFYKDGGADYFKALHEEHGCACVEMESFALFHNADALGKKAACLLTISDSLVSKEEMSASDRQNSFRKMIRIALETAVNNGGTQQNG